MKRKKHSTGNVRRALGMGAAALSFFVLLFPRTVSANGFRLVDASLPEQTGIMAEPSVNSVKADESGQGTPAKDNGTRNDAGSNSLGSPAVVIENTSGKPFSIDGNGEVLDDAADDGSKEFLTIQTKNSQTFFIVIDRSRISQNVYMLSMVDENDLEEFLDEEEEEPDLSALGSLDGLQADEALDGQDAEEAPQQGNGILMYIVIIAGIVGILGGYYYFKLYKPQKREKEAESENLEQPDEGYYGEEPYEEDDSEDYAPDGLDDVPDDHEMEDMG